MPAGKAALFMALLLGAALAGTGVANIAGVHSTCNDQSDNDADGGIDDGDENCLNYPWADGAGEKYTNIGVTQGENGQISGSMNYPSTAFAYWLANPTPNGYPPCDLALHYYNWPGGTWDNSAAEASAFLNDPNNGCPPPPPPPPMR
jgi:hypothetical protein